MIPQGFSNCPFASSTRDLFALSAAAARLDGLVLEFGVRSGGSLKHIVELFGPAIGFDSFDGLPEPWFKSNCVVAPKGYFASEVPEIEGARLVKGLFADTLPEFLADQSAPVRFAHIDCDLYSSTVDVLRALKSRIVPGTVLQFDELCRFENSNYDFWEDGEWRALQESGLKWRAIGRTRHEQASLIVL